MNRNDSIIENILTGMDNDEKRGGIVIRPKVKDIINYLLTYTFKEEDFELMVVWINKHPLHFSVILNNNCYLIITDDLEYNVKICKDKYGKEGMDTLFCSFNTHECKYMKSAAIFCISKFVETKYKKMLDSLTLRT